MTGMRILITGITGFVGSHLAEFALDRGAQVGGGDPAEVAVLAGYGLPWRDHVGPAVGHRAHAGGDDDA